MSEPPIPPAAAIRRELAALLERVSELEAAVLSALSGGG